MTEPRVVFVRLLDEGTTVYRPVNGVAISDAICQLETKEDYDQDIEQWEFPPGSTVFCETRVLQGELVLVAVAQVDAL